MWHSKIIEFLSAILPFKPWKGFLIRRHIEHCPACQSKLAQVDEVKRLFVQAEEISGLDHLWPAIQAKLEKPGVKKERRRPSRVLSWRWAVSAAGLVIVLITGFWLFRNYHPDQRQHGGEAKSFEINYLKIENEPARTFVYQPKDSRIIIVWAEKNT